MTITHAIGVVRDARHIPLLVEATWDSPYQGEDGEWDIDRITEANGSWFEPTDEEMDRITESLAEIVPDDYRDTERE